MFINFAKKKIKIKKNIRTMSLYNNYYIKEEKKCNYYMRSSYIKLIIFLKKKNHACKLFSCVGDTSVFTKYEKKISLT